MIKLEGIDREKLIQIHKALATGLLYHRENRPAEITLELNHSSSNRILGLEVLKIVEQNLLEYYGRTPLRPYLRINSIMSIEPLDISIRSRVNDDLQFFRLTIIRTYNTAYLVESSHEEILHMVSNRRR